MKNHTNTTGASNKAGSHDPMLQPTKAAAKKIALPSRNLLRWDHTHKHAVVMAVLTGQISVWAVCRRYFLTVDEFLSWEATVAEENRRLQKGNVKRKARKSGKPAALAKRKIADFAPYALKRAA